MYRKFISTCAALLALASSAATADELTSYVESCMSELNFAAGDVPTDMNCNDGLPFEVLQGTNVNDFVGHARINAAVDLVFACRWLREKKPLYSFTAVSIELLIHNRDTGGTCFFAAKDFTNPPPGDDTQVSTAILSPTASNPSSYWMSPTEIENKKFRVLGQSSPSTRLRCVGCHVAGPYVASNSIAPVLARFGLLNDGHDTFADRYHSVYTEAFQWWNTIIQRTNSTVGCSAACHSIGTGSTAGTIPDGAGQVADSGRHSDPLIVSLQEHIRRVTPLMPPGAPANPVNLETSRNWSWVNMNSPYNNPDGDFELLWDLKNRYSGLHCDNPVSLEAHVVDSDESMWTNELPDKVLNFNLQDGLACLNTEQPNGRCHDYQVRYMCNGKFTAFQSNDTPTGTGDWEARSVFKNLCASPTWIQTRVMVGGAWKYINGPADRLAQFDNNGLVCYNSQQDNGQCSNYVVRFDCPR